eukprot:TRINITY_DN15044_c0_g2_i1.p1 TRINITY_DN15044_c0_g2~~TRINITY_DN15044_c0_g2_i1.p1  ORF type:complete len:137 (-),score=13.99 TRINITY_DN15044_c0_g2_i1:178-588(-)
MSAFTPFTAQGEESDEYTVLFDDGYHSSLYKKSSLFLPEEDEGFSFVPKDLICPKCCKNYMETFQLAPGKYIIMCSGREETHTKEIANCIYPLDSDEITYFMAGKDESIHELHERVHTFLKGKVFDCTTSKVIGNR